MKVDLFNFDIPEENIAYYPWQTREETDYPKMMIVDREKGTIKDSTTQELKFILNEEDVFVYNNSKPTFNAYKGTTRKVISKDEKRTYDLHLIIVRAINQDSKEPMFEMLVFPSRILRVGNIINIGNAAFTITDYTVNKGKMTKANMPYDEVMKSIEPFQFPCIPNYINRNYEQGDFDFFDYYLAEEEGSLAPDDAAQFLSKRLVLELLLGNVKGLPITYHLNMGCFADFTNQEVEIMDVDSQMAIISKNTQEKLNTTKGRKLAVGLSSLKTMEENVSYKGVYRSDSRYIAPHYTPGKVFRSADMLLTGIHMPKSQYLVTATSFIGYELAMKAYIHAIKNGYKFGMYGDSMLII